MERKEIEVFSEASNFAVVRMPGRSFPGCAIQGDSLSILHSLARSIHGRVAACGDEELSGDAAELVELLDSRLRHYEEVLTANGIRLPYTKR